MRRRVKRGSVKRREMGGKAAEKPKEIALPKESLEHLVRQREEINALLSSLEDAYTEATILEDDYNDIKSKNEKRLEEINKKIEILTKSEAAKAGPKAAPVIEPEIPEAPVTEVVPPETPMGIPVVVKEKVKKEPKKKEEELLGPEDLKKLEMDLAERVKEMVAEIGTKINEKDVLEIKNSFAKFETEMEKMKALIETIREGRKISDEKIQRITEGLAEIRTMVYGREAATKEWEVKMEKITDVMNRIEPEKIIMEMGKRDKEMSDQRLEMDRIEETTKEFGEMLKRIEKVLRDIGSLENVVKISNEASEKLMIMENIERSNQKMLDKIQGIYAELSKRMEEFMLYKAKQDRVEDLVNEVMKSLDDINTKIAYFVTKDDLESLRASIAAAAPAALAAPAGDGLSDLKSQKEEIQMLMDSLEEEFKGGVTTEEEYEKMKKANQTKIEEIEKRIKYLESGKGKPTEPKMEVKPPKEEPEEKPKKVEKEISPERKEKDETLLKDLEETFKKGFISKEAYEKTKKMILGE